MSMTAGKIDNFYDLMDSTYDVSAIIEHSKALGHILLIDKNPKRDKELQEALVLEAKARKPLKLVSGRRYSL
jgi:hypothetical protein